MTESMRQRRRRLCLVASVCVALGGVTGIMVSPAAAQDATSVAIGFAGPLTGPSANYGKDLQLGIGLAIAEANAQKLVIGGKPVTFALLVQDDQGDPRVAVQAAQRLVDSNVVAVVGHFNSGTTIPASAVYHRAGIPHIVPAASNPSLTHQGFAFLYRPYGTDNTVADNAAAYGVRTLRAKRIAVVDDRTAYGQGLADEFEKAVKAQGGTLVDHEFTSDQAVDFRAIVTTLKARRADLVFFAGLGVQGSLFAKQARQVGFDGRLMAGATFANPAFLKLAGSAANGMLAFEQGAEIARTPGGQAFLERFCAMYHADPVGFAAFAYNAAWVAINGMRLANSTQPAVFGPAIGKLAFQGVLGKIAFDANGDLQDPKMTLYQAVDGRWQAVRVVTAP
ncbi:branched-chain amino acid ABC transporter substrate-binding protein [Robbsia sp. Bb-Pol-6]|uniref:Branched-chain amino acid ABC transporter substrate-binding protein n=1 Tax=Robbsia betulipollinis TaxID=2981849 RepID=A0ABT3ZKN6_9BURK|nr:branched-chain amino acid ABC transporter substrate-binding protein [Robbsia betulipollinis]MCY0387098.1 branched-chain amino acid ABC transporter substrate-binding protein [Robbsia betulipollinis]